MTVLLVSAAAAIAAWFLLLLALVLMTRARDLDPGSSTSELGDEPPAVVNLLVQGWRVTPDAVPATLLDLAAREYLDLDQLGPSNTVCQLRETGATGLRPYERRVLQHVRDLAVEGVVPAAALSTGPAGASAGWWKAFEREVVKDARARGLSRDRWSGWVGRFLGLAAVVPAALVGLVVANSGGSGDGDPVSAAIGAGLLTWVALIAAFRRSRAEQETAKGAEAARRWLGVRNYLAADEAFPDLPPAAVAIWDRYLAYAAAMGVARAAVRALPMGAEDDRWAWSSFGGRWRKVEVDYPNVAILWGRHPLVAFLFGLLGAVPAYGLARVLLAIRGDGAAGSSSWLDAVLSLLILAAFGLMLLCVFQAGRAVVDLGSRRSFRGLVLRMRKFSTSSNRNGSVRYTVAVDDGKASKVKAFVVSRDVWGRTSQGDLVDVTVGPRLGYVFGLHRSGPADADAVPADTPIPGHQDAPARSELAGVAGLFAAMAGRGVAVDPAALVTGEDAARALGEPVGPPEPVLDGGPGGGVRACQYQARSGDHASVLVFVASDAMARMISRFNRRAAAAVPELGGHALLREDMIAIATDDLMVSIRLRGPGGVRRDTALKQLGAAAMTRLGMHLPSVPTAGPALAEGMGTPEEPLAGEPLAGEPLAEAP
jgi:hypothetical protein